MDPQLLDNFSLWMGLLGVLFALVGIIFSLYLDNRKKILEDSEMFTLNKINTAQVDLLEDLLSDLPEIAKQKYINYLVHSQKADGSFSEIGKINSSIINLPEIEKQVEERVLPLKKRIEEIERRFPNESTIEKIASVNEAVLATRLDSLTESIRKNEGKLLTKWDVTVIVLKIIGALGVITGIVFGIINYFITKGAT